MVALKEVIKEYGSIDCRDLGSRQLECLRDALKTVSCSEIISFADGCSYIELLNKFRQAVAENDKLHGENYPKMLNSLLSVGEDGLYADNLRFIFELIQNVDDCEYEDLSKCELDMHFDFNNHKLTLKYNEIGFTPFNVFAITGIAEAAKNVSAQKNEIGEKGIGFKSVFGVADKVIIRSGWFAFSLSKENFTIPVVEKSDSEYCNGTEMVLFITGKKTEEIYRQLKKQYCHKDALFNKNPLLFLNKLTRLKMYYDEWRSMDFHVSRKEFDSISGTSKEDEVFISVDLMDYENGTDVSEHEEIECARYITPVMYTREACKSRYGENTELGTNGGKKMLVQAVVPYPEYVDSVGKGGLYSFLPTQLKFNVPVVCHAPFKLDASREFVDPQKNNLWFEETSRFLSELLDYMYNDWCRTVKKDIILYLPYESESIFARNNGKELCLTEKKEFKGKHYLEQKLFIAGDSEYCNAKEIIVIPDTDSPELVYDILAPSLKLFVPGNKFDSVKYGIASLNGINNKIFDKALQDENKTEKSLNYLTNTEGFNFTSDLLKNKTISFTSSQIMSISKFQNVMDLFVKESIANIQNKARPFWNAEFLEKSNLEELLGDDVEIDDLPSKVKFYLQTIKHEVGLLDIDEPFWFASKNLFIMSRKHISDSLADFCGRIDRNDAFAINIQLRKASQELDKLVEDGSISAEDYLYKLRGMRKTVRTVLGNSYNSYVNMIIQAGTSSNERFINELLQNADDCIFDSNITPEFSFKIENKTITCSCNEKGFTKNDVRAITAIGESTKKRLAAQSNEREVIGEKGIGFKTVFAVADKVEIHSNDFHFKLEAKTPTIPQSTDKLILGEGTTMVFNVNNRFDPSYLNKDKVLELCLCLRNLKILNIDRYHVEISDSDNGLKRTILIDDTTYEFDRFTYPFKITDKAAIESREEGVRVVDGNQSIVCYIPSATLNEKRDYYLYSGLPTDIKINVPFCIDAPFMLRTSRDRVLDGNRWNSIVQERLYEALTEMLVAFRDKLRAKVLSLIGCRTEQNGVNQTYHVSMFSDDSLNDDFWFIKLKQAEFLPTFNKEVFISVNAGCKRFAPAINHILRKGDKLSIDSGKLLDVPADTYDVALSALGCNVTGVYETVKELLPHVEKYIQDEQFRKMFIPYLMKNSLSDESKLLLRKKKIIPVYTVGYPGTMYVDWSDGKIFTKSGKKESEESYYVLNEDNIKKYELEKILDVKISEMDTNYEIGWYIQNLRKNLSELSGRSLFEYIMNELNSGKLDKFNCIGEIANLKNERKLPLLNSKGEITTGELFIATTDISNFFSELIPGITLDESCNTLARKIGCRNLSDIYFDDLDLSGIEYVTADDIETFEESYFNHSAEIISGLISNGYVENDLIEDYGLEGLSGSQDAVDLYEGEFPNRRIANYQKLKQHIAEMWKNPKIIEKIEVKRTVSAVNIKGKMHGIDTNEIRKDTIQKYCSEDNEVCYCQMCKKPKAKRNIEINNLQKLPKYYWAETRIALCLECSKVFKEIRGGKDDRDIYSIDQKGSETFYNRFLSDLMKANPDVNEPVEIPCANYSITFTQTHLAEIQEIFKLTEK